MLSYKESSPNSQKMVNLYRRDLAFNSQKNALAKNLVLKSLDFEKPFEPIVDACAQGIGKILH